MSIAVATGRSSDYSGSYRLRPVLVQLKYRMQYYDVQKNWRKVKRYLNDPIVIATMVEDFNKFTFGRWGREFTADKVPADFESCDWSYNMGRCGRHPAYWSYVKHSACHWLVNLNLELAMRVERKRPWRIHSSQLHSTVWDGEETLFDMNFMALGITPDEAWKLANKKISREVLKPGEHLRLAFAMHYKDEDMKGHRANWAAQARAVAWAEYLKSKHEPRPDSPAT